MEMLIAFVTLLLGLAVGAFIVWFAKEGQTQQAIAAAQAENLAAIAAFEEKTTSLLQREGQLNQELMATRHEMDQRRIRSEDELNLLRQELSRVREEQAQSQAQLFTERQMSAEKQRILAELEQRFSQALGAVSQQAVETASQRAIDSVSERLLQSNSQSFLEAAKEALQELRPLVEAARETNDDVHEAMGTLGEGETHHAGERVRAGELAAMVRPLDETLRKVEEQLRVMERERIGDYQTLLERVRELGESQSELRMEAGRLASAMRTPVQRGLWGEIQLRRVVEMAGMLEHCEFRAPDVASAHLEDSSETDGFDPKVTTDLTVHLPGARSIAVNSNAPVNAYLDALAAENDDERERRMQRHALDLRIHVDRLNRELSSEGFATDADFVVAFLPGEAFLTAALAQDPALLEYALENRVLLTTPTTLVSLLKTASYGWRQEEVAENARQLRDLGKELYERLRVLSGHFNGIKRGLETTLRAYNDAAGSMETRVLSTARRFKELGASNGHPIPDPQPVGIGPKELHLPEFRALVGTPNGNGDVA